ncbi:TIGR02452 family protein [Anaerotignum lactatifermentans]|uniref:TIGR02452 family protein n=1 Tax=Anaerotignum lactatifermentans TaxID=160404 RepID=UPI00242E5E10|nr:TIGR02452 family protein [Anaerotignum lactatifermentans]
MQFERDGEIVLCDVIACAAPNKTVALKYCGNVVTEKTNLMELQKRILFVLNIAAKNNVDTLILGAYGCGVFGQSPIEVAKVFKKLLSVYRPCQIIFAIPQNDSNKNFEVFQDVFK